MLEEINGVLENLKDKALREQYQQIITTLFEKGYFPGLENIPVARSGISNIDGKKGVITFRGYPVEELADHCSYEEVCFLLLKGDLPLAAEKDDLKEEFLENKELSPEIQEVIISMSPNLHPMCMLSSAVLQLQSNDLKCFDVEHYNANLERALRLIAKFPTIIGTYRTKDPDFAKGKSFDSFAHYALYCFNQELAQKEEWIELFDKLLVLHADHTMNNSTFSVRAVGSSKASIYASISSAINSLSGPLHGGANEEVIKMLERINSPAEVESYIEERIELGQKIMGVGHRVYKTYDPRALYLKNKILPLIFEELEVCPEIENLYHVAQEMEKIVLDKFGDKELYPNVDFWSGIVIRALGIKIEYFTTVFALGRIIGWTTHWVENMKGKNKIFRPNQLYDGFNVRHVLRDQKER